MDRRKAERYSVSLRCYIGHEAFAGKHLAGYVENLSRAGLLIRCAQQSVSLTLPAIGDELEIDVEMPAQRPTARRRSLHCFATVIRHAAGPNGESCFAASITELQFRDLPLKYYVAATASSLEQQVV